MAGIKRCCENWGEAAQGTAGWAESRDSRSAGVDPLGSHRFKQREERAVVRANTKREEVMFGDGFERSTILRAPYGASGPKACEHQSRHQEKYHYGAGIRRRGEEDSERAQNEQGSSCLEGVPRSFVRRSFTAEPVWCGGIVPMAVAGHAIVQKINASRGGASHTVTPIQKRTLFVISASASANGRSLPADTSSCSNVFKVSITSFRAWSAVSSIRGFP
jgi:hypothetical protein